MVPKVKHRLADLRRQGVSDFGPLSLARCQMGKKLAENRGSLAPDRKDCFHQALDSSDKNLQTKSKKESFLTTYGLL